MFKFLHFLKFCVFFLPLLLTNCSSILPKTTHQLVKETSSETIAFIMQDEEKEYKIYCSGVWVGNGVILTAYHCMEFAAVNGNVELWGSVEPVSTKVHYTTQEEDVAPGVEPTGSHMGVVAFTDSAHDLAMVFAFDPIPAHEVALLAKKSPEVGTSLHFVGHPGRLEWTHMDGKVAALRKYIQEDIDVDGPFVQVSAPIFFGNSGGGAFSDNGELVGIASFIPEKIPHTGFYIAPESINKFIKDALDNSK